MQTAWPCSYGSKLFTGSKALPGNFEKHLGVGLSATESLEQRFFKKEVGRYFTGISKLFCSKKERPAFTWRSKAVQAFIQGYIIQWKKSHWLSLRRSWRSPVAPHRHRNQFEPYGSFRSRSHKKNRYHFYFFMIAAMFYLLDFLNFFCRTLSFYTSV